MKIETDSGVRIEISDNKTTKLMVFDKPIRAIELSKTESSRVGGSLIMDKQSGLTSEIRKLVEKNFFAKPKRFREISQELRQNNVPVKLASLNMILKKMVERKELSRSGQRRSYKYQQLK